MTCSSSSSSSSSMRWAACVAWLMCLVAADTNKRIRHTAAPAAAIQLAEADFPQHFLFHPNLSGAEALSASEVDPAGSQSFSANGFVSHQIFRDQACTDAVQASGQPVNVCNVANGYSYRIRLTADSCAGGTVEYYYDSGCTKLAGSSPLETSIPAPCTKTSSGNYVNVVCTTSTAPPVATASAVTRQFQGSACNALDTFSAVTANQCVTSATRRNPDVMYQCKDDQLTVVQYTGMSKCKGTPLKSSPSPSACQTGPSSFAHADIVAVIDAHPAAFSDVVAQPARGLSSRVQTDDDVNYYDRDADQQTYVYDDYVYIYEHDEFDVGYQTNRHDDSYGGQGDGTEDAETIVMHPPPSVSATPFPTAPTALHPPVTNKMACQAAPVKKDVSFTVKQTIVGVALPSFAADAVKNEKSLKQTIAGSIMGCTEASVTGLVVTAASTASSSPSFLRSALHSLTTNSVLCTYTVSVPATVISAAGLAGHLQIAVSTGRFDTALHKFATANHATALTTATSGAVVPSVGSGSGEGEGVGGSPSLATGAIIAISVGGFAVLSVVVCLLSLLRMRAAEKPAKAPVALTVVIPSSRKLFPVTVPVTPSTGTSSNRTQFRYESF